jgi:hypothetical protein
VTLLAVSSCQSCQRLLVRDIVHCCMRTCIDAKRMFGKSVMHPSQASAAPPVNSIAAGEHLMTT